MSKSDIIADALTMIRNAIMARKENLDVPASNTVKAILEILKTENYIDAFKLIEGEKRGVLRIYLKYNGEKCAIRSLKRISKSSRRVYVKKDKIPHVLRGRGLAVISTSKGIVTDTQARDQGLGGEVVCYVW
jgi:small subunit ribosomal protein S8